MLRLKRVYEKRSRSEGERVLVERLWPRGVAKAAAAVDLWLKEVAPSPQLRNWFGHDPARWEQFKHRYWKELEGQKEAVDRLRRMARQGPVTLVYAARDERHNSAVALKEFLDGASHEPNAEAEHARHRASGPM